MDLRTLKIGLPATKKSAAVVVLACLASACSSPASEAAVESEDSDVAAVIDYSSSGGDSGEEALGADVDQAGEYYPGLMDEREKAYYDEDPSSYGYSDEDRDFLKEHGVSEAEMRAAETILGNPD